MKKYIGLDVGDVRIGVAKSDSLGMLATPLEVINRNEIDPFTRIEEILNDENTRKVVVGIPISLDGTKKRQVEKVEEFINTLQLKIDNIEINTVDERYSTSEAEKYIKVNPKRNSKNIKNIIDKVAAAIILQHFLDKN